jgi:hypothetical protein
MDDPRSQQEEGGEGGEGGTEALRLALAREKLGARAEALRLSSEVEAEGGTGSDAAASAPESAALKPGTLLSLRGARARGCLQPGEVGQLEYRIPREYKPLRVICESGSTALYRMGDVKSAPAGSAFKLPPRITAGSLVVSALSQSTTCFPGVGQVAKVLIDDGTDTPFKLDCPNGARMWTQARMVRLAPEGAVFEGVERLQVGALVVPSSASATVGACLSSIDAVGKLIKDDGTNVMPYKVMCPTGRTWWHNLNEVKPAPEGAVFKEDEGGGLGGLGALFILIVLCCCCCNAQNKEKRG